MTKISNQYSLTNILTADLANSRLGINNVSPTVALDVTGAGKFSGALTVSGAINLSSSATFPTVGLFNRTSDTTLYMVTATGGFTLLDNSQNTMYGATPTSHIWNISNSEKMRITSAGNVGIGTSSPSAISTYTTLDIRGATGGGIKIGVSGSSTPFNLQQAGTDAYLNNVASGVMYFLNGDVERMRITSGGLLQMSNNSTTFSIGAIGGVQRIQHGTNGFTTEFQFFGAYDGYAPIGASAFNTRSDYRLKEDLKEFSGLSLITDMKVYDFKWKEQDERNYGFMAHELQEIVPYVVTGTKDGMFEDELQYQGLDYSKLVPVLVKAIQELSAKVSLLENK